MSTNPIDGFGREAAMLRSFPMSAALCILATWGSLWVLAGLPARGKTREEQVRDGTDGGAVPTHRTPTNKNDCLVVAQPLNDKAKTLSKRNKQGISREFTRVASDSARLVASRILVRRG